MFTTRSVYLDVATDGLTRGDVQTFTRTAAALGKLSDDPVERVSMENDDDFRPVGLRVEGDAPGAGPAAVEIARARLLELHDALAAVADGDGDARAMLGELARHRDWLRDVLLGR